MKAIAITPEIPLKTRDEGSGTTLLETIMVDVIELEVTFIGAKSNPLTDTVYGVLPMSPGGPLIELVRYSMEKFSLPPKPISGKEVGTSTAKGLAFPSPVVVPGVAVTDKSAT
jgi:hypothetical protein